MKIEDLIDGKFYQFMTLNNNLYYFKLEKLIGKKLYIDNFYIVNDIYHDDIDHTSHFDHTMCDFIDYVEIHLKDIYHLFPDTHPDKKAYIRKNKILCLLKQN